MRAVAAVFFCKLCYNARTYVFFWRSLTMKIVHTADWHLGKIVQGIYMTEDQRYILQQFIAQMRAQQPDVIIIAGDLYDRALPPVEAVQLLNETLDTLINELEIPVICVAGNHDSPSRLAFGSELMAKSGYYVAGEYHKEVMRVVLHDEFGEVHFHLVPFTEPSVVRLAHEDETITTHQAAMAKTIETITSTMDKEARHVLIGHAFVTKNGEGDEANTSDSERPLTVGGVAYVDATLFEPFHYTALGHLHKAHKVGSEKVRYAGTPLKYSLSERLHQKGYYIVELDATGEIAVNKQVFEPRYDLRQIEGNIEEILQHDRCEDYVFVRLTNEHPVASPMERVRTVYPNAMHVVREAATAVANHMTTAKVEEMNDLQLFESFYQEVLGKLPADETAALFLQALDELEEGGRRA